MGEGQRRRAPGTVGALLALAVPLVGCAGTIDDLTDVQVEVAQPWAWEMPQCVSYQPVSYQAAEHHRLAAETLSTTGGEVKVETYQPGYGPQAITEIEDVLGACARYEYGESADPAAFLEQHLIVEHDFAGEDSLLVETVRLQPPAVQGWCSTVVRSGDQVATVRVEQPEPGVEPCRAAVELVNHALATEAATPGSVATGAAGPA